MTTLSCHIHPTYEDTVILVAEGEPGYHPWKTFESAARAADFVLRTNSRWGLTEAQAEARLIGSLFGWHVPGAQDRGESKCLKS
jgi:hypothetical protein